MADAAFVDIDTQYDFMNPDGNLYVPGALEITPNLKKLIEHARDKSIPVVGSVDAHTEDDPEFKDFPPHCVIGAPGQKKIPETTLASQKTVPHDGAADKDDLAPPGPVILEKRTYTIFDNPNAPAAFKATGARRFYVFGVALDICVKAAANELLDRGYEVYVVEDATAAVSKENGENTIKEIQKRGGKIVSTAQVLKEPL